MTTKKNFRSAAISRRIADRKEAAAKLSPTIKGRRQEIPESGSGSNPRSRTKISSNTRAKMSSRKRTRQKDAGPRETVEEWLKKKGNKVTAWISEEQLAENASLSEDGVALAPRKKYVSGF